MDNGFLAACDESGVQLAFGDWWHRQAPTAEESYDVCDKEYRRLPATERSRFVPINCVADLHAHMGPPPPDGDMPSVCEEAFNRTDTPVVESAQDEQASKAVDTLLENHEVREVRAGDVLVECARLGVLVSSEVALRALVKAAKQTPGLAFWRGSDEPVDGVLSRIRNDENAAASAADEPRITELTCDARPVGNDGAHDETAAEVWAAGHHARLAGLLCRPDLNGAEVVLLEWFASRGRWGVRCVVSGERLSVRPTSLEPSAALSEALGADASSGVLAELSPNQRSPNQLPPNQMEGSGSTCHGFAERAHKAPAGRGTRPSGATLDGTCA